MNIIESEKIVFKFLEGSRKGDVASFQQMHISIGRASDSDLLFDSRHDRTVSSHHAVVRFQDHCFELADAHSTNGTYLNGQRTTQAILKTGDVIRLGALGPEVEIIIPAERADYTVLESDQSGMAAMARTRDSDPAQVDPEVSEKIVQLRHRRFIRSTTVVAIATAAGIAGFIWTLIEGFELTPAGQYFKASLSLIAGGVLATFVFACYHGRPGRQRFKVSELLWMVLIAVISLGCAYLGLSGT